MGQEMMERGISTLIFFLLAQYFFFVENPDTKTFKWLSNGIHTPTVCTAQKTNERASLAVT